MATYECESCGMAVNASCAKCEQPLENDHLTLDDGSIVQISICFIFPPKYHVWYVLFSSNFPQAFLPQKTGSAALAGGHYNISHHII